MVIVNPKSGSGAGKQLLRNFRAHLHPAQVVDVLKSNIAASLRWIDEHPNVDVRILIAGGDGTICSALDQIDTLSRRIPVSSLFLFQTQIGVLCKLAEPIYFRWPFYRSVLATIYLDY